MEIKKVYAFNNSIDTWLRLLTILNASFPSSIDREKLVYLDYITIHSWDFWELDSLHPPLPTRKWEIYIRRNIINEWLNLLEQKWLIELVYTKNNGIEYKATDLATPFIDSISETYIEKLNIRANWTFDNFFNYSIAQLKNKFITNYSWTIDL